MKSRALSRRPTVTLTEIGFGGAQAGNLHRATTDDEFAAAFDTAWDAGIRYFDTAPHYGLGLSETRLGEALRQHPRSEYAVSTKVGRLLAPSPGKAHRRDSGGFDVPATHERVWDFSRDGVRRSLDGSLSRLGLDHIDMVYLHDPDDHWEVAAAEAVPALVDLRDLGVVGAIGAGMNQSEMLTRFVNETDMDVVMCAGRYTLLEQGATHDLLPLAAERGVDIVIAGVYNSGLLASDRPQIGTTYDYRPAPPDLIERVKVIADVCESFGVTLPEAALAFVRSHPSVVSTVVGLRDASQVNETLRRAAADVPDDLWPALRAAELLDRVPASG